METELENLMRFLLL